MDSATFAEAWCTTTLGEIAEWGSGGTPSRKEGAYYGGEVPWVKTGDLGPRVVSSASEYITELGVKNSSAKYFPKGSVAMAMYGATIGKTSILGMECTTNQACAVGNPMVGVTSTEFLFYFLRNEKDSFIAKGKGGAQPNISQTLIKKHEIKLPPLAEQKVIADKLDTLLAQVETTKARLERIPTLLKAFRQSVLAAAVSGRLTEEWRDKNPDYYIAPKEVSALRYEKWVTDKAREFSEKGKTPKSSEWKKKYKLENQADEERRWSTPESWAWVTLDSVSLVTKLAGFEFTKLVKYTSSGDIPVIKAENVTKQGFKKTNFSLVPLGVVETLPRTGLFGNEILIVFVGAGVGQVAITPSDQKYFLGPNVAVVRNQLNLYLSEFLEAMLRSQEGQKNLLSLSKGAAQPSLSMTQIRQTSIPLPPIEEQTQIVHQVETLFAHADKIEQQAKAALERVNNLTQSILAKAFRGELTAHWRAANPDLISGDNSAEALLAKIKAEREALQPKPKRKAGRKKKAVTAGE